MSDDIAIISMSDPDDMRQVQCPACNGEGRMVTGTRHWPGNWYEPPETEDIVEICAECQGDGWVIRPVKPITMEDIEF